MIMAWSEHTHTVDPEKTKITILKDDRGKIKKIDRTFICPCGERLETAIMYER